MRHSCCGGSDPGGGGVGSPSLTRPPWYAVRLVPEVVPSKTAIVNSAGSPVGWSCHFCRPEWSSSQYILTPRSPELQLRNAPRWTGVVALMWKTLGDVCSNRH